MAIAWSGRIEGNKLASAAGARALKVDASIPQRWRAQRIFPGKRPEEIATSERGDPETRAVKRGVIDADEPKFLRKPGLTERQWSSQLPGTKAGYWRADRERTVAHRQSRNWTMLVEGDRQCEVADATSTDLIRSVTKSCSIWFGIRRCCRCAQSAKSEAGRNSAG